MFDVLREFLPLGHLFAKLRSIVLGVVASPGKTQTHLVATPLPMDNHPRRATPFAAIQSLQEEEKLPKRKEKQSLKEIQEAEEARAAEEDLLKWRAAEEERVKKEEEALRITISIAEGGWWGAGRRQRGRGGGNRKSSRGKQRPERRHTALPTGE